MIGQPMDSWLPATVAVSTTLGRIFLAASCLGILSSAIAMVRVHNAQYEITAHRASLFAAASFVIGLLSFGAAILVGPRA